jgi:hypothetical protein
LVLIVNLIALSLCHAADTIGFIVPGDHMLTTTPESG